MTLLLPLCTHQGGDKACHLRYRFASVHLPERGGRQGRGGAASSHRTRLTGNGCPRSNPACNVTKTSPFYILSIERSPHWLFCSLQDEPSSSTGRLELRSARLKNFCRVQKKPEALRKNPLRALPTGYYRPMISAAAMPSVTSALQTAFVVIWMHGLGDVGSSWAEMKREFGGPQFQSSRWIFPDAPIAPVTCNGGNGMSSWFDLPTIPVTKDSPNMEGEVMAAVRRVHAMIDKEVESGVSPSRILLGGFSQGGALALVSSMLYRETLLGAVVFSGWVPLSEGNFLGGLTEKAKKTPVLWCHGNVDKVVEFEAGGRGPPLLASAGVQCTFKDYPGVGHSLGPNQLGDMRAWVLALVGQASS